MMMKKLLFLLAMILLPLVASSHDIEVQNGDGVTIYYNYFNNGTELEVTFRGDSYSSYSNEYQGNVVIPEEVTYMNRTRKVTSIGYTAFYYCSGLTSVIIPNSVTSIGRSAFDGCSSLTSVTIPNSVTSIGNGAFYNCSKLTSVIIPNSVTSIGEYAFYYCSKLSSVIIPNSVTSIEGGAFMYCSGLTSVTIPNSVTSIGDYAFYYCSKLTSVIIPNSVTSIGDYAFKDCSGLTSVTIGNSVTSIGSEAFRSCTGLTSVTIGNSVTSIGNEAFSGCSGLQKVIVKDIAAWCRISFGDNPLYYAKHLYSDENTEITDLVIPNSVTSIGDYAFEGCSGLTSVTIGNSVTSIGYRAFYNCSGLTSVTIGNSVTIIGGFAFYNCSGLEKVIVKDIAAWCRISFWDNPLSYAKHLYSDENTEITDLVIPNSVTSIRDSAFRGCSGLTSVTIGNSVTSIGGGAFAGVDIPTIISLIENPFTINGKSSSGRVFTLNTFNNATLYVPEGTKEKYKATDGWKDFWFIEEGTPAGIKAVENTRNNKTAIYDLNGVRLPEPKRGVNIINGKKVVVK